MLSEKVQRSIVAGMPLMTAPPPSCSGVALPVKLQSLTCRLDGGLVANFGLDGDDVAQLDGLLIWGMVGDVVAAKSIGHYKKR